MSSSVHLYIPSIRILFNFLQNLSRLSLWSVSSVEQEKTTATNLRVIVDKHQTFHVFIDVEDNRLVSFEFIIVQTSKILRKTSNAWIRERDTDSGFTLSGKCLSASFVNFESSQLWSTKNSILKSPARRIYVSLSRFRTDNSTRNKMRLIQINIIKGFPKFWV